MYCIYCGKKISDDSLFCVYCGKKQELSKNPIEKEIKVVHEKNRSSDTEFSFIDNDMYLKYAYYDIEVKGSQYIKFDITKIEIDKYITFELEPTNEYDKNAIKIMYDNIFIGYVPKNNIQSMIHDYIVDDEKYVEAFISMVDEDKKYIQIAIAFYQELTDEELKNIPHIDTSLIKTTKKDDFDTSRQDNLESASEGDKVDIDYEYDTETYVVTDYCGNELGEINKTKSEQLREYEMEGKEFYCSIQELGYNDSLNITCKIRILIK